MNNDIKGICIFLGLIGIGYVALLLLIALITGAKIFKSVMLISALSSLLISLGLTSQIRNRLSNYLKSLTYRQFA